MIKLMIHVIQQAFTFESFMQACEITNKMVRGPVKTESSLISLPCAHH